MRKFPVSFIVIAAASLTAFAQDQNQDSPVAVIDFKWERVRIPGEKIESASITPVRAVIPENKVRQRNAREQQSQGAIDPNEYTIDGRSAALERTVQEARSKKIDEREGFRYAANVRNLSDRKIDIIFWEYRFRELANSANVTRRQFVCSVKLKPGNTVELFAISILGPSEVIDVKSLADPDRRHFEEKILINRIEFTDGAILQRRDWKMDEIKTGLDKATSTAWSKEVCRSV